MAKSKKVKPIILPDGFADINPIPDSEFAPKQSTMDRFADRYELQLACDQWLRIVFEPPAFMAEEPYPDFDDLTQALMLWASLHELGDGWQLIDAATAAYRREPIGDAVWRAQAFIELMKNRSRIPRPTVDCPTAQPTARAKSKDKRGLTVREVARDHLRVNTGKVYGWIRRGELKATNTSTDLRRKRWIITQEALAEFQARRKPETPPKPAPRRRPQPQMRDYFP
jgi:hypothetical protein